MPDSAPLLLQHLDGMYAIQALAVGERSGALAALLDGPGDAAGIAERAGLDERNVAQWLRCMHAAGYARHDAGVFRIDPETATTFGDGFAIDARGILDFVYAISGDLVRRIPEAMRAGAGVAPAAFTGLGAAASRINSRLYRAALVDEWIASDPALRARLETGAAVADIACGDGDAAAQLARAFPRSRVIGVDPDAAPRSDVANLELYAETAEHLGAHGSFALITCLDALHHLGDPVAAVRQAADALDEDGVLLIAETSMTGDIDRDAAADPFALFTHTAGLFYCMQDSLAGGGDGATPSLGLGWVDDALAAAGLGHVDVLESETGFRVFLARRPREGVVS
ncbi:MULTISPECIES: class I SAM-dependent methyltransferase [unclassified Microbacterium]|uniref:class I SAM-dependent methyltransferase n=1 Tax=unclassified Microbacterium TaxID=2609290 RepID=UPI0036666ED2